MHSRPTYLTLLSLLALVAILLQFRADTSQEDLERFHIDEVYWIGSTYYYDLAWLQRDWSHTDWQLLPARENPPLGKYVMGMWLGMHGKRVQNLDLLGSFYLHLLVVLQKGWGDGERYQKRQQVADRIDPDVARALLGSPIGQIELDRELLRNGRELSMYLGMLATLGVFWIGYVTSNNLTGLISAYLFSVHPVFFDAYHRAMIDVVAINFSVYTILFLVIYLQRIRRVNRNDPVGGMIGLFTAFFLAAACGSKMNALVIVGVLMLLAAFSLVEGFTGVWTRRWNSFVDQGRDSRILQFVFGLQVNDDVEASDRSRYANQATVESCQRHRQMALWGCGVLAASLVFFVLLNPTVLQCPVSGLIGLFEEHRITGEIQAAFMGMKYRTPWERWPTVFDFVMQNPMRGVILYSAVAWHFAILLRKRDLSSIVLIWWWVSLTLILLWMPFNWIRYTLPLVPPTALILGRAYADLLVGAWNSTTKIWGGRCLATANQ